MTFEYMSNEERVAVDTMNKVLSRNLHLQMRFKATGVALDRLSDPGYADYLGDLLVQELGPRVNDDAAVERVLNRISSVRCHCHGQMNGTITDRWERYPLEAMLRLIWRNRRSCWHARFLKGDWRAETMPDMWHMEVRGEGNRRVFHCSSLADGSYFVCVLSDYKQFGDDLRQFLQLHCGSVWLSGQTTLTMEVEV